MSGTPERLKAALADRYTFERELGRGGMAMVYLAHDLRHDRPVALKVLHPELAATDGPVRFLQEVRLTAKLDHPHIVPVLDSGEADGILWFTMPYVRGETLRDRLRREGQLPVNTAVDLTRQVAAALDYAHKEGVVHRDLKPANILLADGQARVADFGVAKALAGADGGGLTQPGLALGTPAYMAPEQATAGRVDSKADVYALGCVTYEMLAGEPPYTAPTAQTIVAKRFVDPVPSVRRLRREVPEHVDAAVLQALAKAPADRFHTAGEFADAISQDSAATSRPLRARLVAGGIALTLVAGAIAALTRSPKPDVLDENLLAVAPFDAVSSGVAEYHEGLVTILSRSLDGAGPLRTISPTVVVRRWTGRSDPTSASNLGYRTGAGLVVFGQVVPAGADSVRLTATIYDVRRARPLGEVEVRDERQRIDRIADTLAVRLLREVGRTRPIGAVRFAALGSTSLPAIKLFLQAEQFYRSGQWDSTSAYARGAVALDSNFTLALRRVANGMDWGSRGATPLLLRAGARNRGLAPRESLLVTIDSLRGALSQGSRAHWPLLRRLDVAVTEAVNRYPDDPEAWYVMGDMVYHYGGQVSPRRTARDAFEAFGKAIELDSAFAPAYEHMVWLGHLLQDPESAGRYAKAYLRLGSMPEKSAPLRAALDLLANPKAPTPATTAFLDTASAGQLWDAVLYSAIALDSAEAGLAPARAYRKSRKGVDSVDADYQQWVVPLTLAYRGHVREAATTLWASPRPRTWGNLTTAGEVLALGGPVPESAVRWLESLLREGSEGAHVGLAWWAAHSDAASLRRFEQLAESRSRSATTGTNDAEFWTYQVAAVRPYLALAQRDTSGALELFAAIPDSLCRHCYLDRLRQAQLLSARKRDREALALLDEPLHDHEFAGPTQVLWALEQGRTNERLGNREKALESYSFVVAAWRNADAELQPMVQEAKQAVASRTRLEGTMRTRSSEGVGSQALTY